MRPWQTETITLLRSEGRTVFTPQQLRASWTSLASAPVSLTLRQYRDFLLKEGELREVSIAPVYASPEDAQSKHYPSYIRYVRAGATAMEVGLSLRTRSYLSHGTAAELHQLITSPTDRIYINKEQTAKDAPATSLTQDGVDRAFKRKPRESALIYSFEQSRLVLVNGKQSEDFEVIEDKDQSGGPIRLTTLERTLVDITVRPVYAGGMHQVALAFERAKNRISIAKIVSVVRRLDYIYPYHQAVGFYLARAGYSLEELHPLRSMEFPIDFYLGNEIEDPIYDKNWKIFYPQSLR